MNYRTLIGHFTVALICTLFAPQAAYAGAFGGTDVTPTAYSVTLTKVEFIKSGGGTFTFFEGSDTFDIAAVAAGAALPTALASGNIVEPGDYTGMRFTVTRTFGLTTTGVDNGAQNCGRHLKT